MMRIMLMTAFLAVITLAVSPAFALTIAPQSDVLCGYDYCSLTINASKYLATNKINALKAMDLNSYLVKNGLDLKYSWNGTLITFYASMPPFTSRYWTLNTPDLVVDPWFNTSQALTAILEDGDTGGAETLRVGANVTVFQTVTLNAKKDNACTANTGYLSYKNGTLIQSQAVSGDWANFTVPVGAGVYYVTFANSDNSSFTNRYKNGGGYPQANAHLNITYGAYYNHPSWLGDAYKRCLKSITSVLSNSTYYEVYLAINGAQANITTGCSWLPHNYTGWTNLTGMPISIRYNSSVFGTGTTSYMTYPSLTVGYWNITANVSVNASTTGGQATLFHNITIGNATTNVSIITNATNGTACAGVPLFINCSSYALEDGVAIYNDTEWVGNSYTWTAVEGLQNFSCRWNASECYASGQLNTSLNITDCSIPVPSSNSSCSWLPESVIYKTSCFNSSLLVQTYDYANNTCYAYHDCQYGCDNVTNICRVAPVYEGVGAMIVIGLFIWGVYYIWRRI